MWGPKTYILVCHGCGKFHEIQSHFMSVPMMMRFDTPEKPGHHWAIPCLGCPDCVKAGEAAKDANGKLDREKSPIARAYDKGMTKEACERAEKEFLEWLPKLVAKHASGK